MVLVEFLVHFPGMQPGERALMTKEQAQQLRDQGVVRIVQEVLEHIDNGFGGSIPIWTS